MIRITKLVNLITQPEYGKDLEFTDKNTQVFREDHYNHLVKPGAWISTTVSMLGNFYMRVLPPQYTQR